MKHIQRTLFPSFLLVLFYYAIFTDACIHDQVQGEILSIKLSDTPREGRMLVDYQAIRVHFDYSHLTISDTVLYDYIVNELIPPAKHYLTATLKVKPLTENLTISADTPICLSSITVPSEYETTGVAADLVIFVTAAEEESAAYVAYSIICAIDNDNNRPVFGKLNFNTAMIQQKNKESQRESDLITTLHEITHILGFSSSVYNNYINPTTGATLTGHRFDRTVNGMNVPVLNVEPLTKKLQTYFGCDSLEGAYLENEGTSGSKGSHFERRIFFNEYMTASRLTDSRISEFTLALLEGSGWYQVEYSMAEPMTWGKGKGCTFTDGACVDTSTTPRKANFAEFCSPLLERGCSWTAREGSMCGGFSITTGSVSNLINWWGNNTAVLDSYADNCPIYQAFSNTDCEDTENIATPKITGSASGYGSKCFMGTLSTTTSPRPFGSYCFKASCGTSSGNSIVKIQVGDYTGTCYSTGDISVPGMTGVISCPDPTTFCNIYNNEGFCRRRCLGKGTCVGRECQCEPGWGSMDCGKRVYTDCTRCQSDSKNPSCYGDTCGCDPNDNRCNGSGLTTIVIVAIAVGVAVFVIALILVYRYRKAIIAKFTKKKKPTASASSAATATTVNKKAKRVNVIEKSPSGVIAQQEQKRDSPVSEEVSVVASPTTIRQVKLDFQDSRSNTLTNQTSPMREFMADRAQISDMISPRRPGVPAIVREQSIEIGTASRGENAKSSSSLKGL